MFTLISNRVQSNCSKTEVTLTVTASALNFFLSIVELIETGCDLQFV